MDLELDDEAFVRAPPAFVYRWLADLSTYPAWWPGFRVVRAAPAGASWESEAAQAGPPKPPEPEGRPPEPGESVLTFELRPGPLSRPLRVVARPHRFRPAKGVFLDLRGDLVGLAEWWLEEGWGGTVVHHLVRADSARRRPAAVADAYRTSVRRATWRLKDGVQSEIRDLAGLPP